MEMEQMMEILEEALQEAIDVGSRGTAVAYTAAGMSWHLYKRLQEAEENGD